MPNLWVGSFDLCRLTCDLERSELVRSARRATSWFVGQCGCLASLVFRVCSSDRTLLSPRVRAQIVHGLFTVSGALE
jgi:hypothetical protein